MGKIFKAFFGGAPQARAPDPVQTDAAVGDVEGQSSKSKKARVSQFATEGGVSGQELQPGQVKQRDTLLGN